MKVWAEKDRKVEEKLRLEREELERIKKEQEAAGMLFSIQPDSIKFYNSF